MLEYSDNNYSMSEAQDAYSVSSTMFSPSFSPHPDRERSQSVVYPSQTAQHHWQKLRTTVKATHLFKNPNVSVVEDLDALLSDVQRAPFPLINNSQSELTTAIDAHRTVESLFAHIYKGGLEDLEIVEGILKADPRRYLRASVDARSLVNKKNPLGRTLVYEAAMLGNHPAVELLMRYGADVHEPSPVDTDESESPLEVACRWGHLRVVQTLLHGEQWSKAEIKAALKVTKNGDIRSTLDPKKVKAKRKLCFFCF